MKSVIIFLSLLYLAYAGHQDHIKDVEIVLKSKIGELLERMPKEVFMEIFGNLENLEDGAISADVSDYTDKIMSHIATFMVTHGLDPTNLPSEYVDIGIGSVNLTNGWLSDISTLTRNGEVVVSYSTSSKLLSLDLPIKFDDLQFTYDYHTKVTLISIKGGVIGEVKNVKAHVVLTFDFNEYHAKMDTFDIKDTGSIHIEFTGNDLVDWITNAMSSVLTTFLHPIIIDIVQLVVKSIMNSIVDAVNNFLDELLHRT